MPPYFPERQLIEELAEDFQRLFAFSNCLVFGVHFTIRVPLLFGDSFTGW